MSSTSNTIADYLLVAESAGALLARFAESQTMSRRTISDWVEAVWTSPTNYPSLRDSILTGDQIVLAVQSPSWLVNEFAEGLANRIATELSVDVRFAVTTASWESFWEGRNKNIPVIPHDPDNQQHLAMLAINAADQPLYVNRDLFDADVVIPISVRYARDEPTQADGVIPSFYGAENQTAFAELATEKQLAEIRQVTENLGTFAICELGLLPGGEIGSAAYGEREAVYRITDEFLKRVWRFSISRFYSTVVATIETPPRFQNWTDFSHAVIAADECAAPGAKIVIVSQLATKPNREIRNALMAGIEKSRKATSSITRRVSEIAENHPIFLVSQLKAGEVESLGLGCIENVAQFSRVIAQEEVVLLRDAQQVIVSYQEAGRNE